MKEKDKYKEKDREASPSQESTVKPQLEQSGPLFPLYRPLVSRPLGFKLSDLLLVGCFKTCSRLQPIVLIQMYRSNQRRRCPALCTTTTGNDDDDHVRILVLLSDYHHRSKAEIDKVSPTHLLLSVLMVSGTVDI